VPGRLVLRCARSRLPAGLRHRRSDLCDRDGVQPRRPLRRPEAAPGSATALAVARLGRAHPPTSACSARSSS
jgi:hypothetical protein